MLNTQIRENSNRFDWLMPFLKFTMLLLF